MADLNRLPNVLEQLQMVAGLRWRILKNGLRRKSNRWDLVGVVFAGIFSGFLVVGVSVGLYAAAYTLMSTNRANWMIFPFWGILAWWQLLPIFAAGFGANFDFGKLLRFPLSPLAFYLLGLSYGIADFGAVSAICWITSMLVGVAVASPHSVRAMLGVSVLFVFFNVSLERLIGSWLEKLLAKRRARELFFGLFILSMVSVNFLNPLLQRYSRTAGAKILGLLPYVAWLPSSLAGNAVAGAAAGDQRDVVTATAGLAGWACLAGVLLWQRFAAQYRGEGLGEGVVLTPVRRRERPEIATDGPLSFVPSPVLAVAAKEFRYLTRNGFAFLTLLLPPVMVFFFTLQFASRHSVLKEHRISTETFFPAVMAYLILILMSPAYNSFAYEGKGIQAYFMAPMNFRDILLGKNLFLAVLVLFELVLSVSLLVWRIGWPTVPRLVATLAAAVFAVLGQLAIANWSSLSFPKKMEIGRMKGQRNSGVAVWTAFGVQLLLGSICTVILLAGRWFDPWLPAIAFAGLTAAALGGYVASLNAMNRLAEEKKELLIETLCR